MTLSALSDIFTRAPVATGINPPSSTMRPALISRSRSFCTASIKAWFGIMGPLGDVTIYMKRMLSPVAARSGRLAADHLAQ